MATLDAVLAENREDEKRSPPCPSNARAIPVLLRRADAADRTRLWAARWRELLEIAGHAKALCCAPAWLNRGLSRSHPLVLGPHFPAQQRPDKSRYRRGTSRAS